MKNTILVLYLPCPGEALAKKISTELINEKAAACVQSISSTSTYSWNGKMENTNEIVLIIKSLPSQKKAVKKIIKKLHSYDVPCILHNVVKANKKYYQWVKQVLH